MKTSVGWPADASSLVPAPGSLHHHALTGNLTGALTDALTGAITGAFTDALTGAITSNLTGALTSSGIVKGAPAHHS